MLEPVKEVAPLKTAMNKTSNNPIKQKTPKQKEAASKRILEALINRETNKYLDFMNSAFESLPTKNIFLETNAKHLKYHITYLNDYIRQIYRI